MIPSMARRSILRLGRLGRSLACCGVMALMATGCMANHELRLAQQLGAGGNWDGAVLMYEQAVKRSPNDPSLRKQLDEARLKAADIHYDRGRVLLKENKIDAALDEFKRALEYDSSKQEHRTAFDEAVQARQAEVRMEAGRQLMKAGRLDEALGEFEAALEKNPSLIEAQQAVMAISEKKRSSNSEEELALSSKEPITLKFQGARLKEVFELLSKSYGVNILFDRDVRDDPVTVFLKDASFPEALNLILATNNLFMKRINDKTILIAPKTKAKANQYEDLQIRTFYLSVVPAKDMVNLLRTMLDTRRVFVNNDLNAIVMRDTVDKLDLASKIIAANDRQAAEVMLDVEVIEVDRNKLLTYGWEFSPPSGPTVTGGVGPPGATSPGGTMTLNQLTNLTSSNVFLTLPTVVVDLIKQDSDAQTLLNPRLRVLNGGTAKINVGDKVPILLSTSSSTGTTATTVGGTTTITSTEYKDTGIKVSIEPNVYLNNDVRMKLNLEVITQGEFVTQAQQYKFGNRTAETVLNVHDGETVVIGGLIGDQDQTALNKIPVLGDIPYLGKLFSHTNKQKLKTDLIMTITPHVVRRLEPPSNDLLAFWSGTEEAYSTSQLFSGLSFGGPSSPSGEGNEFVAPPPAPPPASEAPSQPQEPPPAPQDVPIPSPPIPPPPARPAPSPPAGSYLPVDPSSIGQAVVHVAPEQLSVGTQEPVSIMVKADQVLNLSDAEFVVSYDPAVLEFDHAVEGGLMSQGDWATSFSAIPNPELGQIDLRIARLSDVNGAKGSGALCTLIFRSKAPGASPVAVVPGSFTNPDHVPVPVTALRGVVVVR
jgi:general secretion pathway protein D